MYQALINGVIANEGRVVSLTTGDSSVGTGLEEESEGSLPRVLDDEEDSVENSSDDVKEGEFSWQISEGEVVGSGEGNYTSSKKDSKSPAAGGGSFETSNADQPRKRSR